MRADPAAAAQVSFGAAYEHLDRIDRDVIRSCLEPCFGTMDRARQFERLLVSLDAFDLQAVTPQLKELTVPTLVVWGTGDAFFDVSWAHWLRDTIPGATGVVTVERRPVVLPGGAPHGSRAAPRTGPRSRWPGRDAPDP